MLIIVPILNNIFKIISFNILLNRIIQIKIACYLNLILNNKLLIFINLFDLSLLNNLKITL
jgi:hypothetical protein